MAKRSKDDHDLSLEPVHRQPGVELGQRGQRKKQLITDAARRVLSQKGYSGTTFEDVATEADVSRASVYTYFPSKRDLLLTIAIEDNRRYQELSVQLVQALEAPDRAADVRQWAEEYVDYVSNGQVTFVVWDEAAASDDDLRLEGLRQHLMAWGRTGKALDEARGRPAFSQELQGLVLLAAVDRMCFYTKVVCAPFEHDEVIDAVVSLVELLICEDERRT